MKLYDLSQPVAENIIVDVDKGRIDTGKKILAIQQGEHDSRLIQASLVKEGNPVNLENSNVYFLTFSKGIDKVPSLTKCEIFDAQNGLVKVYVKDYMSRHGGTVEAEFVRIGADKSKLPFAKFPLNVDESLSVDESIENSESLSALVEALADVAMWDSQFEQKYQGLEGTYARELTETKEKVENYKTSSEQEFVNLKANIDQTNAQLSQKSTKVVSKEFGADGRDNLDSSRKINNAIDFLNNGDSVIDFSTINGGTIELPEGIFYFDDSIIMKSNLKIVGQGQGKTILVPRFKNVDKFLFDVRGTDTNHRLCNFEIRDLSIMPSAEHQYAISKDVTRRYEASIFNFEYTTSCRITDVVISGFRGCAINGIEMYDSVLNGLNVFGCGDDTHNSIVLTSGTSDGCNAIHFDNFRFEHCAPIRLEALETKFLREIQFGIGKFEQTGVEFKGVSSVNFVGSHFTWSDINSYLLNFKARNSGAESYGIKFVGCSFITANSIYAKLSNNQSDCRVNFTACSIKGFDSPIQGDNYVLSSNEFYDCKIPIFSLKSNNIIKENLILAPVLDGNYLFELESNNIIALNRCFPSASLPVKVTGATNELIWNIGFTFTGSKNWDASNNYQKFNSLKAPHNTERERGNLRYDINTKQFSFYDGTEWINVLSRQVEWVAPLNTENPGDIAYQFNDLIKKLVASGIMKSI